MSAGGAKNGSSLVIELPDWVDELTRGLSEPLVGDDACIAFTIRLAEENAARGGGPFGATVFAGGRLLAAGVNCVLESGFSIAHAEIIALMRAQAAADRSARGAEPLTLFASAEPCCQCFGALVWASVRRLVCAATTADAEAIGFDEGPKPEAWAEVLERRGISVVQGLRRADAQRVLRSYAERGGVIYGKPAL